MLTIFVDRSINKLVLITNNPSHHYYLETKTKKWSYISWKREWGWCEKTVRIYENLPRTTKQGDGTFKYIMGLGWTAYILGIFKNEIGKDDYDFILKSVILSESYRNAPFPNLRDYQNDDILFLLKYKIGLMVVNTGYGKTESIATLTNYAHTVLGKNVLIVTPSNKARDEIVKRCDIRFGLNVSTKPEDVNGKLDCMISNGLKNTKRFKNEAERAEFIKILSGYDWVLVDEVEYTINDGGEFIFNNCLKADHFYGFSGTADKYSAKMLSFANGLSDESVVNNVDLIKFFGPALVYRLPLNISITRVSVKTDAFDSVTIDREEVDESGNIYTTIMNNIWTNNNICNVIIETVKKYPGMFIPINNLNYIIDDWIKNYFMGVFRILLVSGAGYTYYDLGGNKTMLNLKEACEYIKDGKVDVIPSTSSGYRALDFPNLENILLIQGKVAGIVLQSIGRVARGKHMNIITLDPKKKTKKIPIYTKGARERDEMIKEYYKYCEISELDINEEDL